MTDGRARRPGRSERRRAASSGTDEACLARGALGSIIRADGRHKERDLGDDLLSQTVASPVPSALTGLTAVFGMGTGVSPSLWSPKSFSSIAVRRSALGTARITHDRPPALIRAANLHGPNALRSEIDGQALDLLVPLS